MGINVENADLARRLLKNRQIVGTSPFLHTHLHNSTFIENHLINYSRIWSLYDIVNFCNKVSGNEYRRCQSRTSNMEKSSNCGKIVVWAQKSQQLYYFLDFPRRVMAINREYNPLERFIPKFSEKNGVNSFLRHNNIYFWWIRRQITASTVTEKAEARQVFRIIQ